VLNFRVEFLRVFHYYYVIWFVMYGAELNNGGTGNWQARN
jgi:hypothetical protein